MRRGRPAVSALAALAAFVLGGLAVAPAAAQPLAPAVPPAATAPAVPGPAEPDRVVGNISVEGNVAVDSSRILQTFDVPPGSRYSEEVLRRGLRKLFGLGLFDDAQIDRLPREDGSVDLVIRVRERPRIARVVYRGNQKRETAELEKKTFLRPGETFSYGAVRTQTDSLLKYYREEGFPLVRIEGRADTTGLRNEVAVVFEIDEGEKVRIEDVVFEGVTAVDPEKVRKQLKSKKRGWLGGGDVKEEHFAEDKEKAERWYRSHGYRDMRFAGYELLPGSRRDRVVLKIKVEEGSRYRFGQVEWSGGQVIPDERLRTNWPSARDDTYDLSRIERAQGQAFAEYAEKGYLYISIEPRETVRDSIVDLQFVVTEGRPSRIRHIDILGNKGTREHVARREMSIHEGDLFRRSALVRTQGDLMRLGLFEEVIPDFTPAESTDVDIQIRVKEKQVGTASAGAGYTGETGITGFLELSHNNILGNGQSLSLHLERGARRSNYYISFTEPWFRGTPTLLSGSIYNNSREYTGVPSYNDKRVGGSVRLGRPLPWFDYTRGSVAYSLENVEVLPIIAGVELTDTTTIQGRQIGSKSLTSTLQLSLLRNTVDNPFYPTRGSRSTLSLDFAGGPFGGNVNFWRTRLEGRAYFRGVMKGVTTMLRGRVGIIQKYPDQNFDVPSYERFRMGGATTLDPLRGYDEYSVVPEKFVRDIYRDITVIDTTGSTPDTLTKSIYAGTSRYPGGKYMTLLTFEQQFPIVLPLRGVVFLDAGNTWDEFKEIQGSSLKVGAGAGLRMEVPVLGNLGFDYGYGFHRDQSQGGPKWQGYFLFGTFTF